MNKTLQKTKSKMIYAQGGRGTFYINADQIFSVQTDRKKVWIENNIDEDHTDADWVKYFTVYIFIKMPTQNADGSWKISGDYSSGLFGGSGSIHGGGKLTVQQAHHTLYGTLAKDFLIKYHQLLKLPTDHIEKIEPISYGY